MKRQRRIFAVADTTRYGKRGSYLLVKALTENSALKVVKKTRRAGSWQIVGEAGVDFKLRKNTKIDIAV